MGKFNNRYFVLSEKYHTLQLRHHSKHWDQNHFTFYKYENKIVHYSEYYYNSFPIKNVDVIKGNTKKYTHYYSIPLFLQPSCILETYQICKTDMRRWRRYLCKLKCKQKSTLCDKLIKLIFPFLKLVHRLYLHYVPMKKNNGH